MPPKKKESDRYQTRYLRFIDARFNAPTRQRLYESFEKHMFAMVMQQRRT